MESRNLRDARREMGLQSETDMEFQQILAGAREYGSDKVRNIVDYISGAASDAVAMMEHSSHGVSSRIRARPSVSTPRRPSVPESPGTGLRSWMRTASTTRPRQPRASRDDEERGNLIV